MPRFSIWRVIRGRAHTRMTRFHAMAGSQQKKFKNGRRNHLTTTPVSAILIPDQERSVTTMKSTYEARAIKFARLLAVLFAGCTDLSG